MSHRGNLTERMAVIPLLIAERPHSQRELAELLQVNSKTIRRDLDILTRHYPIVSVREDKEVRYRYSDDYRYQPPNLTPAELATLLLAQESIATTALTTAGSPFAKYGRSLLAKVRASLPTMLREKLDALAMVLGSATVPAKDFTPYAATIDCLTRAAVDRRRVMISYYTLARKANTERKVDPYCIYIDPDGATLKLVGFDHYRNQIIPFAIDHIRSISETAEIFERPEDFELREHLAENCFNGIHGAPVTVRLRARGVTARVFAERTFHRSQRLIEQLGPKAFHPQRRAGAAMSEPGAVATRSAGSRDAAGSTSALGSTGANMEANETTTIEMRVAGGRGLVRFILGWGPDVEVLSPPELREEVANAHGRAASIYSTSSDREPPSDEHS